jgi:hypothetical protein
MSDPIKPSTAARKEALILSEELLRNIELSELPLTNAVLKASRLARLLNEFDYQKVFEYEAGGYPSDPDGVTPEVWKYVTLAGRTYQDKDKEDKLQTYGIMESIEQMEAKIESAKLGLDAARDANISISSANPHQFVNPGTGNASERRRLQNELQQAGKRLGARRAFLHSYVVQRNLELKFSTIASDAFSRIRDLVDKSIGDLVPSTVQKFSAIYENLQSENPEDWSNAVHGCRRVLQDLADVLFPATDEPRKIESGGKIREVKLGPDNYINRLIYFADNNSSSERTKAIIGSQMSFLGDRLDALFQAAQKGSHATIASREEADRYVVYTYMAVGDLLQLRADPHQKLHKPSNPDELQIVAAPAVLNESVSSQFSDLP